eukprot:c52689_g1_i1.p1 GENE.c52689_g1_i1~~c52689_g1_i1.p1  ORF type:complete len:284 (+),score=49.08 c52689_g1_i1:355-1206(+)
MSAAASRGQRVPEFLTKLYGLVSDAATDDVISWNDDGTSLVIHDVAELEASLLGQYYKHSNMKSFHRQLSLYQFRKVGPPSTWEFVHAHFQRDAPELLSRISRSRATASTVAVAQAAKLESEVSTLKRKRSEMEDELEAITTDHAEIQARLDAAEAEAVTLRTDLQASKQATQVLNAQLEALLAYLSPGGAGIAGIEAAAAASAAGSAASASVSGAGSRAGLKVDTSRPAKRQKGLDEDFAFAGISPFRRSGLLSGGGSAASALMSPRNWEELSLIYDLRNLG